jgi:hypothetical protein
MYHRSMEAGIDRREALRRRLIASIPRWYSPWLHLALPSLFGLSVMLGCFALLQDVRWYQVVPTVIVTFLVANASEWRAHRDLLHRRSRFAPVLYDRHTPEHHALYLQGDMAIREVRELRLVLIPAYGIVIIFVGVAIPAALMWLAGFRNVALVFVATEMAYTLSYEWLHLAYHLPADTRIGRSRLVARLRRHHAIHHDPRLMQRYNFNVTVPLWDWLRGTLRS